MKTSRMLMIGLCVLAAAALMTTGCPSGGLAAPSSADVSKAFMAMNSASGSTPDATSVTYSGTGPYTYTSNPPISNPYGGSAVVTYSSTTDPKTSASNISGSVAFTNWFDPSTGYTINGTLSVSLSSSAPGSYPETMVLSMTGNLTLTGGQVSTLGCNINEGIYIASPSALPSITISGTVTANGYQYNITQL